MLSTTVLDYQRERLWIIQGLSPESIYGLSKVCLKIDGYPRHIVDCPRDKS